MLGTSTLGNSTLAFLHRALRVDARSIRPYLARAGVLLILLVPIIVAQFENSGAPGLVFLSFVVWMNFAIISMSGVSFLGVIIEEREEGTLGLLQMASVSPLGLLLGKGVGALAQALLLLMLQVPYAFLSVPLGGVSFQLVARCYLNLGCYLAMIASLGLLLSVFFHRRMHALIVMVVIWGAYMLVPAIFSSFNTNWFSDQVIYSRLYEDLTAFAVQPGQLKLFDLHMAIDIGAALLLFGIAWSVFSFRQDIEATPTESVGRSVRPSRRVWRAPILWKEFWFTFGGRRGFIVRGILYGGATGAMFFLIQDGMVLAGVLFGLGYALLYIEGILIAQTIFHNEIRDNTLSTLSLIPLSLNRVVAHKLLCGFLVLIPSLIFVGVGTTLFAGGFGLMQLAAVPGIVFYLLVTAYLSLYLRWWAFVVAYIMAGVITQIVSIPGIFLMMIGAGFGSSDPFGIDSGDIPIGFVLNVLYQILVHAFLIWLAYRMLVGAVRNKIALS